MDYFEYRKRVFNVTITHSPITLRNLSFINLVSILSTLIFRTKDFKSQGWVGSTWPVTENKRSTGHNVEGLSSKDDRSSIMSGWESQWCHTGPHVQLTCGCTVRSPHYRKSAQNKLKFFFVHLKKKMALSSFPCLFSSVFCLSGTWWVLI